MPDCAASARQEYCNLKSDRCGYRTCAPCQAGDLRRTRAPSRSTAWFLAPGSQKQGWRQSGSYLQNSGKPSSLVRSPCNPYKALCRRCVEHDATEPQSQTNFATSHGSLEFLLTKTAVRLRSGVTFRQREESVRPTNSTRFQLGCC